MVIIRTWNFFFISLGIWFQIRGPEYLIACLHLSLDVYGRTYVVELRVVLSELTFWLSKIVRNGGGRSFSANLCIIFDISSWYIWFALNILFTVINFLTLSVLFKKTIIRKNLFAQAWIFLRIAIWPWYQIVILYRTNITHNHTMIELKKWFSI